MKKTYLLSAIVGCSLLLFACKKQSNNAMINLQTNLQSSEWKISKMFNHSYECTDEYSPLIISFKADRSLLLKDQNITYYGEWRIDDSNQETDVLEDLKLSIYIAQPSRMEKLNNIWKISIPREDMLLLNHYNINDLTTDQIELTKH